MEEVLKALGPWPLIQGMVLGMIVAAAGFWAMRRGMQENRRRQNVEGEPQLVRHQLTDDERKQQWKFFEQMDHLHENSFAMKAQLEKMVETELMVLAAINRLADHRWNKGP